MEAAARQAAFNRLAVKEMGTLCDFGPVPYIIPGASVNYGLLEAVLDLGAWGNTPRQCLDRIRFYSSVLKMRTVIVCHRQICQTNKTPDPATGQNVYESI